MCLFTFRCLCLFKQTTYLSLYLSGAQLKFNISSWFVLLKTRDLGSQAFNCGRSRGPNEISWCLPLLLLQSVAVLLYLQISAWVWVCFFFPTMNDFSHVVHENDWNSFVCISFHLVIVVKQEHFLLAGLGEAILEWPLSLPVGSTWLYMNKW